MGVLNSPKLGEQKEGWFLAAIKEEYLYNMPFALKREYE